MAVILSMPKRNTGRVRRSQSFDAAGDITLMQLTNEVPANVKRLALRRGTEPDEAQLGLLLAVAVFAVLPSEARQNLIRQMKAASYGLGDRRAAAILAIIDQAHGGAGATRGASEAPPISA